MIKLIKHGESVVTRFYVYAIDKLRICRQSYTVKEFCIHFPNYMDEIYLVLKKINTQHIFDEKTWTVFNYLFIYLFLIFWIQINTIFNNTHFATVDLYYRHRRPR